MSLFFVIPQFGGVWDKNEHLHVLRGAYKNTFALPSFMIAPFFLNLLF